MDNKFDSSQYMIPNPDVNPEQLIRHNKELEDQVEKDKKRKLILKILLSVAIIIIILLLLFRSCCCCNKNVEGETDNSPTTSWNEQDGLTSSGVEKKSQEEIKAELNQAVQDSMITMTLNPDPTFENGEAEGNLLIENDTRNKKPQVIEIFRDDNGELIWRSGLIPVGQFLNYAKLDVVLEKGDYDCTAKVHAVDEETGEFIGTGAVKMHVHILN